MSNAVSVLSSKKVLALMTCNHLSTALNKPNSPYYWAIYNLLNIWYYMQLNIDIKLSETAVSESLIRHKVVFDHE